MCLRTARRESGPTRGSGRRRAFTLIELLVVIAIIALLIGILLPALGKARTSAQSVRSLSNIRSNALIIQFYANDHRDEFVNPFERKGCNNNTRAWVWVPDRKCSSGWVYESFSGVPQQESETYGFHWIAHTFYGYDNPEVSRIDTIVAPGDRALRNWLIENDDSNAQTNLNWIFPSSYWYPPTFWQDSGRFKDATRPIAMRANDFFFRRNRVSDVLFPTRKVMIFENHDWTKDEPIQFNKAGAEPNVALVEGSARTVSMSRVIEDTSLDSFITGTPYTGLAVPSGLWSPRKQVMEWLMYEQRQGFTWDYTNPGYLWATRNGLQGQDFLR